MLLAFLFLGGKVFGQNLGFTSSPIDINDTIYICQNQTITYTNTSTDLPSSYNLLWEFNQGSPSTSTSTNSVSVNYPTSGQFSTFLTINSETVEKYIVVSSDVGPQASLVMTNSNLRIVV